MTLTVSMTESFESFSVRRMASTQIASVVLNRKYATSRIATMVQLGPKSLSAGGVQSAMNVISGIITGCFR